MKKDLLRMCCVYLKDRSLPKTRCRKRFSKPTGRCPASAEIVPKRLAYADRRKHCKNMRRNGWFRFVERRAAVEQLPLPAPLVDPTAL
jgi:hypothetical protein